MRISNPKLTSRRKSIIVICISLAVLSAIAIFAYYYKIWPFTASMPERPSYESSSQEQIDSGIEIKKQSLENDTTTKADSDSTDSTSTSPKEKEASNVSITATNQDSTTLYIRTLIGTVTSTGSCTITLNGPQQKSYTSMSDVQALPNSSTCKGFNIPLSELSPGSWKVDITFSNSSHWGTATTTVSVQ